MPVITGADLSNVSTTYQPLPAGTYKTRIKAEFEAEPKRRVIVRHKVVESPDGENIGREFSDYIYLDQNDGRPNEIGAKQLKRYFDLFDPKQIAVYTYDEFTASPRRITGQIFEFLGVDPTFVPKMSMRHNVSGTPRSRMLHAFLAGPSVVKDLMRAVVPRSPGMGVGVPSPRRLI